MRPGYPAGDRFTVTVAGGPETFELTHAPTTEPEMYWIKRPAGPVVQEIESLSGAYYPPALHHGNWLAQGAEAADTFTRTGQSVTVLADSRLEVGDGIAFVYYADLPVSPVASFTTSTTSGTVPLSVTFTDTSSNAPTSWAWDFGDGATSTVQNPSHDYATAGTYTVTLTASNAAGSSSATATITAAAAANPQPDAWNPATMLGADNVHPNDTGMTYLADCYEWALEDAGKTPAAGTPVYAYGDSWTATDTQNTPGQRAIDQLASRLSLSLTNRAVSGYRAGDAAGSAIGTSKTFAPGTSGLVVVPIGLNDLGQTDTAQQRAAITNYLRALFAVLCAAQRIEQTSFTLTSYSNSASAIATASGGSNAVTSTEGATATYNITTAGTYYLLLVGTDGNTLGGKFTVTQGATTLAVIDTNDQARPTPHLLTSFYGPLAVRLDNVTAGTVTITYSKNGRAGTVYGMPDALVRISDTPPTILAVKPVEVPNYTAYNKPAMLDYIRDQYDVMAAEFGTNVVVCDPDPSWIP